MRQSARMFLAYAVGFLSAYFLKNTSLQCFGMNPPVQARVIEKDGRDACKAPFSHETHVGALDVAMLVTEGALERRAEVVAAINSMNYFKTCNVILHVLIDQKNIPLSPALFEEFNTIAGFQVQLRVLPPIAESVAAGIKSTFRVKTALVKASIEEYLDMEKVLFVDFDQLWLSDICRAHQVFADMRPGQIFALAPEMSSWYVSRPGTAPTLHDTHPARMGNRNYVGLNSGVIFAHLARARTAGWTVAWTRHVEELSASEGGRSVLALGDQDVYNRMAMVPNQTWIDAIDGSWNVQIMAEMQCEWVDWDAAMVAHGNSRAFGKKTTPLTDIWAMFTVPGLTKYGVVNLPGYSAKEQCLRRQLLPY
jgi:hypothetical protein